MVLPSRCYERFSRLLPGIAGLDVSVQKQNVGDLVTALQPSNRQHLKYNLKVFFLVQNGGNN
ncbi:MAG: hypothetical protein F6K39_44210 [Okeania sp. SIO3B3]|nr:hypothetical protein [Okeania sp. SIO3B3]